MLPVVIVLASGRGERFAALGGSTHKLQALLGDVAICMSTIALAHNLGLKVIAEGVETEAQRDFLAGHRCDVLQGYLLGRPMPATQVQGEFLRWQARPASLLLQ